MLSRNAARAARLIRARRMTTDAKTLASSIYFDQTQAKNPAVSTTPTGITEGQRAALDAALRVDQAGEVAANWIYMGQMAVLGRDPETGVLLQVNTMVPAMSYFVLTELQEMWDQEKKHLAVMDKLQVQHRVRPTLLTDIAKIAGFGLGAVTALMGREAAMACTEAVETVIGEHYDE